MSDTKINLKRTILCSTALISAITVTHLYSPITVSANETTNMEELKAAEPVPTTPEAENKASELTDLMGIKSYEIDKTKDARTKFEEILVETIKDIPSTDSTNVKTDEAPKEVSLVKLEGQTYNDELSNKVHDDYYLFGSYLVKVQNFNPSTADKQKVNIKYQLLSITEQKKVEISKSTKYLSVAQDANEEDTSKSVSKSIIVDMKDVSAPVIKMSAYSKEITEGDGFNIANYVKSVTDDTDTGLKYSVQGDYNTKKEGTYKLTITAKDNSGNVGSKNFTLTVKKPTVAITKTANSFYGAPYVWGGTSPSGFDCSGFVQYVFGQHGIYLPRTAGAQSGAGYGVSASQMKAGDIIIYGGGNHVGIYIGGGKVIHALNPSVGVTIGQWDYPYNGGVTAIRRVL